MVMINVAAIVNLDANSDKDYDGDDANSDKDDDGDDGNNDNQDNQDKSSDGYNSDNRYPEESQAQPEAFLPTRTTGICFMVIYALNLEST
jgi:hypothetical protein